MLKFHASILLFISLTSLSQQIHAATFYVSTQGQANWSGTLPEPDADGSDGPFASLESARDAVRNMRVAQRDERVEILIRGGTYYLTKPFILAPEDSGSEAHPVIYAAYPGEQPIFSGGVKIMGWHPTDRNRWSASVDVGCEAFSPRQLFINGRRAQRARMPNTGFFRSSGDSSLAPKFELPLPLMGKPAETIQPGAEAVVLLAWSSLRRPIIAVDKLRGIATLAGDSGGAVVRNDERGNLRLKEEDARFYFENLPQFLNSTGEWYYDPKKCEVTYWPLMSQNLAAEEAVLSRVPVLWRFDGDPANNRFVRHVVVQGLTFKHTNWETGAEGYSDNPQGAVRVPAAIQANGMEHCVIEDCRLGNLGGYGIEMGPAAKNNRVVRNVIYDAGAGGIRLGNSEITLSRMPQERSYGNEITDNHIHHIGEIFAGGVGILVCQSSGNLVAHNLIHDTYYTGISVGWTWGYGESQAAGNRIEYNHLYNICRGMLDDVGGIYTLGISPGTVIRNNLIHDLQASLERGRGIYLDEGTSGVVVENNVVYRTGSAGFHVHYGKDNLVQNNVFALCADQQVSRLKEEDSESFVFRRNIVYLDSGSVVGRSRSAGGMRFEQNLYFDIRGEPLRFLRQSWTDWNASGQDAGSLVADPLFKSPSQGDFTLSADSPAFALDFQPLDLSTVGPRIMRGLEK